MLTALKRKELKFLSELESQISAKLWPSIQNAVRYKIEPKFKFALLFPLQLEFCVAFSGFETALEELSMFSDELDIYLKGWKFV